MKFFTQINRFVEICIKFKTINISIQNINNRREKVVKLLINIHKKKQCDNLFSFYPYNNLFSPVCTKLISQTRLRPGLTGDEHVFTCRTRVIDERSARSLAGVQSENCAYDKLTQARTHTHGDPELVCSRIFIHPSGWQAGVSLMHMYRGRVWLIL